MTTPDLVITARVDSTGASAGIKQIIDNLITLRTELIRLGKGREAINLQGLAAQYKQTYGPELTANIKRATAALRELEAAQRRAAGNISGRAGVSGAAAGFVTGARPGGSGGFDPSGTNTLKATQDELRAAAANATAELERQEQALLAINTEMRVLAQQAPAAWAAIIAQQQISLQLDREIQAVLSGSAVSSALLNRSRAIETQIGLLIKQRAAINESRRADAPPQVQKKVDIGLAQLRRQSELLKEAAGVSERILGIQREIATLRGQVSGTLFSEQDLATARSLKQILEETAALGDLGLGEDEASKQEEINALAAEENKLLTEAAALGRRGEKALAADEARAAFAGQLPILAEIEARIGRLIQQRRELGSVAGIETAAPGLLELQGQLNLLNEEYKLAGAGTDEFREKQEQLQQTLDEIGQTVENADQGIDQAFDPSVIEASAQNIRSGMGRLFDNVFADLGRRFVATLQFAISAALIFGVQRFLREFLETAIEVERAFADIETALALDIQAPRGTVEFRRQVEEVRQDVLLLAQDLNVLPTVANEAAFKMVARFDDIGNAMIALRSQLLATKVSTIEQGEVLRALTAVAEGFAASTLDGISNLTLQERLLQRETAAALGYAQALDIAVHIQQQFGIDVEDTLEGTARATEVFRQLGFTLIQTEALVASVGRQLGQTGAQSSEKLVRSLGQITAPKIRNALLDLASATESFALQTSDFENGAEAWFKIADQFDRIAKADPGAANQILQIIGQRREVEAVAAALGTADLQQAIVGDALEAVGAAEQRFGFLEQTVSEVLKSIATGFQELSQNFERLGGLASVKLFLKTLDEILKFLNDALKLVIDLFDAFDSLFGIDITGTVRNLIAMAGALALTLKIAKELQKTFLLLTGTQFGAQLANMLSTFFAASAVAPAIGPALGNANLRSALVVPSKGIAGVKSSLGALGAKLGLTGSAVAALGAVALLTVVSIKALGERAQELADSFAQSQAAVAKAGQDARSEIIEQGLDPSSPEAQTIRLRKKSEALIAARAGAGSALPSNIEAIGAGLADLFVIPSLLADEKRKIDGSQAKFLEFARNSPELVEGATEFIDQQLIEIQKQLVEAAASAFKRDLGDVQFTEDELSDLERRIAPGRGHPSGESPLASTAEFTAQYLRDVDEAIAQMEDTTGTQAEQRARATTAAADLQRIQNDYEEQMFNIGRLPSQLLLSVETLNQELRQLDTDVSIGRISPRFAQSQRRIKAEELRQAAQELVEIQATPEEINKAFADADAALISVLDKEIEFMEATLARGQQFRTEQEQLQLEIELLMDAIFRADSGSQRQIELTDRLVIAIADNAAQPTLIATEVARRQAALAQGFQERQIASQLLVVALRNEASFWRRLGTAQGDLNADAKLAEAILEARRAQQEFNDQLNKGIVAQVRLLGPALSPATRLKAEATKLNQELARALKETRAGDAAGIRQQLRETAAQQAQLELRRTIAAAKSRASVRDSLTQQGLALGGLVAEQRLVAKIIGRNSVEWFELGIAIKNAQSQLFDMVLELEGINRLLGTDLTNPLEQAEAAFIEASRALQLVNQEGGGELEVARAELAKQQSEAGLERARFNVALFDLKFLTETGQLGTAGYISALQALLGQVDTSTHQGKEIFLEIQALIDGLTDDIGNLAFNIPGNIRLPTLFEIRRAVEADSLGVNYIDNRQIDVRVNVDTVADLGELLEALTGALDQTIPLEGQRVASGLSGLTVGVF